MYLGRRIIALSAAFLLVSAKKPDREDLVARAKAGERLQAAEVIRAKFHPRRKAAFEALRKWAERPTPEELAQHYLQLPPRADGKLFYREVVPCWEARTKAELRGMTVASEAPDYNQAVSVWAEVERAFAERQRHEQEVIAAAKAVRYPTELARQLGIRLASDQAWRRGAAYAPLVSQGLFWRSYPTSCMVDATNTAFLKKLLDEGVWPTLSKDGEDAVRAAFMLAQHADKDPELQQKSLFVLERLVAAGEMPGKYFAFLFDRVALAQGKRQRYATQFDKDSTGCIGASPTEDLEGLERRRASVGLETVAEYVKRMAESMHVKLCDDVLAESRRIGS